MNPFYSLKNIGTTLQGKDSLSSSSSWTLIRASTRAERAPFTASLTNWRVPEALVELEKHNCFEQLRSPRSSIFSHHVLGNAEQTLNFSNRSQNKITVHIWFCPMPNLSALGQPLADGPRSRRLSIPSRVHIAVVLCLAQTFDGMLLCCRYFIFVTPWYFHHTRFKKTETSWWVRQVRYTSFPICTNAVRTQNSPLLSDALYKRIQDFTARGQCMTTRLQWFVTTSISDSIF